MSAKKGRDAASVTITVPLDGDYVTELERRLEEYDISNAELARAMEATPPQVARWLNRKNKSGKNMQPSIENIARIERAILAIRKSRQDSEMKRK